VVFRQPNGVESRLLGQLHLMQSAVYNLIVFFRVCADRKNERAEIQCVLL